MKTMSFLPVKMYGVAIVSDGIIYGKVYGSYLRRTDAEKALERLGEKYIIISTGLVWGADRA